MNLKSILLLGSLIIGQAMAAQVNIASITNEADSDVVYLKLDLDSRKDVKKMILLTYNSRGSLLKTRVYTPSQVSRGVVLYAVDGRDIVKLQSRNLSTYNGGDVTLDFLYNGINGKRKFKNLDLVRHGDRWRLQFMRRNISKMHMTVNKKPLIGTVGIKDVLVK
jgi:hypothetical protein